MEVIGTNLHFTKGDLDLKGMLTYTQPTNPEQLRPEALAAALRVLVESALRHELAVYTDESAALRPAEGAWSAKEVVGHLIDSAGNNLQRIVRLGIDAELRMPGYQQAAWVAVQHYQERHWGDLVILWSALNLHLAHVMGHVAPEHLTRPWVFAEGEMTLGFIMEDYLAHLRHHLLQMPQVQQ